MKFARQMLAGTPLQVSALLALLEHAGMFIGRFAGLWRQYRAAPPANPTEHLL